jgi:hypothetical protein
LKTSLACLSLAFLAGCATPLNYFPPRATTLSNTKTVDRPRDAVWATVVPNLGKMFFVVNNMDKASGFMNVSYSGDPQKFVDCGMISGTTPPSLLGGAGNFSFPGASASASYEAMLGLNRIRVNRTMSLEGRVNLVLEELPEGKTRVTTTARYILQRKLRATNMQGGNMGYDETSITFDSRTRGRFPAAQDGQATECISTGLLETEILSATN